MPKCDMDKLKKEMDEVQLFTETSFVGHTKKHAENICGCISFGLTSPPQTQSCTFLISKRIFAGRKFLIIVVTPGLQNIHIRLGSFIDVCSQVILIEINR